MQRDKLYGLIIFVGAAVVLVWYTFYALIYAGFYHGVYSETPAWIQVIATLGGLLSYWGWAVILPIWIAALLILVIAMWIGWTMLTTPPPVPLEELEELGLDEEEEKEKKAES
ncbi:MAG: hypothetical protein LUQ65_05155 [Candidatus Helarchaeota archaeon]|nr:hypothetical protein [Candidatus Helarchaeota archaeon]